jgi:hypothetical protein
MLRAYVSPFLSPVKQLVKRVLAEADVIVQRLRSPRTGPRVVIFPTNQPWEASSNLRAWLVAPQLRALGWRVVIAPQPLTLSQRRRLVRREKPDVILLQQTRHLLNQPRFYEPVPCVLDADDADFLDPRHQERIAECARTAAIVVGGSRFVAQGLGQYNRNTRVIWTGTPRELSPPGPPPADRGPIVAWAHATPLTYPSEARFVQSVMIEVFRQRPCTFWLFGTNEAEAQDWFAPLRAHGGTCVAVPPMSYEDYLHKVSEAAIGLQPIAPDNPFSRGKSFGKLLAYLSGRVAVVASNAVDHPLFFRHGENGMLPGESVEAWAQAIVSLLDDPQRRVRIALQGRQDFDHRLTTDVFARLLDPVLREAAGLGSRAYAAPGEPVRQPSVG